MLGAIKAPASNLGLSGGNGANSAVKLLHALGIPPLSEAGLAPSEKYRARAASRGIHWLLWLLAWRRIFRRRGCQRAL